MINVVLNDLHSSFMHLRNGMESHLKAMKASPNSPPTMWTPPSGMLRPRKNWRMSSALADHARFCSLIMTLIVKAGYPLDDDVSAIHNKTEIDITHVVVQWREQYDEWIRTQQTPSEWADCCRVHFEFFHK